MTSSAVAGWIRAAALLGAATAVWVAGAGSLPAPPVHRPTALGAWAADLGPAGVAMSLVRVGAVAGGALLGLATLLHLLSRSRGGARLGDLADRLVPRAARHVARGLAGVSVTAGISVAGAIDTPGGSAAPAATPSAASSDTAVEPSMHRVPSGPSEVMRRLPSGTVEWMRVAPGDPSAARLRALPDEADSGTATLRSLDGEPGTWIVERGESFWSIAAEHLTDTWGRRPAVAEVGGYWRELIEANRDRLVTGDPDLIYPGQELRLPPIDR